MVYVCLYVWIQIIEPIGAEERKGERAEASERTNGRTYCR